MTTPPDPYQEARAAHRRRTMTLAELAPELGISVSTCYALAKRKALPVPVQRLGDGPNARRYVVTADVDAHLGGAVAPTAPTPLSVVPTISRDDNAALALLVALRDLANLAIAALEARVSHQKRSEAA